MFKILGIDISSNSTGFALIQGDKLLEYGKINPTGSMSAFAKMYLFSVELDKLMLKYSPDYIGVEDVIQVSSVSVTKILSRFNGIALVSAYKFNNKDPRLFIPSEWKKSIGLTGIVRKCETQLFVCQKYNLLSLEKIKQYSNKIRENFEKKNEEQIEDLRKQNILLKKKKNKEKDSSNLELINVNIQNVKDLIVKLSKDLKKQINKVFDDISTEIYVETGINEDIADAVGISLAYQKELNG